VTPRRGDQSTREDGDRSTTTDTDRSTTTDTDQSSDRPSNAAISRLECVDAAENAQRSYLETDYVNTA